MTNHAEVLAQAFGYLTKDEVAIIKKYVVVAAREAARRRRLAICVNIGAGAGTSGLAIAEAYPRAERYTIDKSPGGPLGGLEGERNAFDETDLAYPTQILQDSAEAGMDFAAKGVRTDFIFVDGDHTEPGIIADCDAWIPRMSSGSLILFHDYGSPRWPNVKEIVDLNIMERRIKLVEIVDTVAVCLKS